MNRYKYIQHMKISHWVCTEEFGLETYTIYAGDIMESCLVSKGGAKVYLRGREYNGIAGLNLDSLGHFKPVYEQV